MTKKVLNYCNDPKSYGCIHVYRWFPYGKCKYISKTSRQVLNNMQCHGDNDLSMAKIVGYPVIMTHAKMKQKDPILAQRALDMYYESNHIARVHFCGLTIKGQCEYASKRSTDVPRRIKNNHSRTKEPVAAYKITQYPPKPM